MLQSKDVGVFLVAPAPRTKTGQLQLLNPYQLWVFAWINVFAPYNNLLRLILWNPVHWHREANDLTTAKWVVTTSRPISSSSCNMVTIPWTILAALIPACPGPYVVVLPRTESTMWKVSEVSSAYRIRVKPRVAEYDRGELGGNAASFYPSTWQGVHHLFSDIPNGLIPNHRQEVRGSMLKTAQWYQGKMKIQCLSKKDMLWRRLGGSVG